VCKEDELRQRGDAREKDRERVTRRVGQRDVLESQDTGVRISQDTRACCHAYAESDFVAVRELHGTDGKKESLTLIERESCVTLIHRELCDTNRERERESRVTLIEREREKVVTLIEKERQRVV